MAESDEELITEVRGLTDYHEDVMSDSDIQTLIDIGKDELRARFGTPDYEFYSGESVHADRSLFWFTCIATKVKAGEIGGLNISVDEIEASKGAASHYDYWFDSFTAAVQEAERTLATAVAQAQLERDNRAYGDDA